MDRFLGVPAEHYAGRSSRFAPLITIVTITDDHIDFGKKVLGSSSLPESVRADFRNETGAKIGGESRRFPLHHHRPQVRAETVTPRLLDGEPRA
jgi:hypothetical protein